MTPHCWLYVWEPSQVKHTEHPNYFRKGRRKIVNQEILKRLDALSIQLGTTSKYIWGVLVHQGVLEGVMFLVLASLMIPLIIITVVIGKREWKREVQRTEARGYNNPDSTFAIVPIVIVGILCILLFCFFYTGFLNTVNPQYFALQRVLEAVGR
jgi:hypothetical protein